MIGIHSCGNGHTHQGFSRKIGHSVGVDIIKDGTADAADDKCGMIAKIPVQHLAATADGGSRRAATRPLGGRPRGRNCVVSCRHHRPQHIDHVVTVGMTDEQIPAIGVGRLDIQQGVTNVQQIVVVIILIEFNGDIGESRFAAILCSVAVDIRENRTADPAVIIDAEIEDRVPVFAG